MMLSFVGEFNGNDSPVVTGIDVSERFIDTVHIEGHSESIQEVEDIGMARSGNLEIPDSSVLGPGAEVAGFQGHVGLIQVIANGLGLFLEVVQVFLGPAFGNEHLGRGVSLVFGVDVIGLHNE